MSEDIHNYNTFNVTIVSANQGFLADHGFSAELKAVSEFEGGVTSNSSNIPTADDNNVSFVNITYTIQPHSIRSLIKKLPSKTILNGVRYVSKNCKCTVGLRWRYVCM